MRGAIIPAGKPKTMGHHPLWLTRVCWMKRPKERGGGWLAGTGAWAAHHGKQALPLGVRLSSDRCHPLASGQSAPATPFYFWPERLEGKGRTLATLSSDVVKKKKTFDPVGSANTITRIGALDFFFFFFCWPYSVPTSPDLEEPGSPNPTPLTTKPRLFHSKAMGVFSHFE